MKMLMRGDAGKSLRSGGGGGDGGESTLLRIRGEW